MAANNHGFDAEKFAQFQQFHQQFPLFMQQMALQPNSLQKFIPSNPKLPKDNAERKKQSSKKSSKKPKRPKQRIIKPLNPFAYFSSQDAAATDKKEINILVIGETGVGKSTWINGIANYMSFNTFDDALNAKKPVCVIPMNFNLYVGEKFEKVNVNMKPTIGERDQNEAESSTGQSCTQEPKVYRYVTDTVTFNLIDTPGIGDTRGVEADMENMKMVLKCLSNWKKLHGICILLKPNVPRLTLSLRYCIEELLVNLHKNSIPNIAVVFTNSCNTLYRPGDTMTVLKKLFDDVKDANGSNICLTGANTFCIDNEAVRLLYAHQKGAEFEKDHIKNFSKSWKHTVNETHRFFEYCTGLPPHWADETKATTQVRGIFVELSKILAEMNEEIMQTKKGCENQTRQFDALKRNLSERQKQNLFQAESIEKTALTYPVTVCCGPNCIETFRIPNSDKQEIFYKKICCQPCPLTNVPQNQIGDPNLRHCTAFGIDGFCQRCGCSWQSHMQIWYSQRKISKNFAENSSSQEDIDHLNLQIDAKAKYILKNEEILKQLQKNYNSVFELCHPYFEFLRQNSIVALNNALEEYLQLSIDELEKVLKPEDDRSEVEKLKTLVAIHQQQKLLAAESTSPKSETETEVSGDDSIDETNYVEKIMDLENHDIIGSLLKDSESFQQRNKIFVPQIVEIESRIEAVKEVTEILSGKNSSEIIDKQKKAEEKGNVAGVPPEKTFLQRFRTNLKKVLF